MKFIEDQAPPKITDLSAEHLVAWTAGMRARALSPGGINSYQKGVWSFCRWLHAQGYIEQDVTARLKKVRVSAPKRRTASEDARTALLKVIADGKEFHRRNAAIVEVLWSTGVRRTELSLVDLDDVDLEAGTIHVLHTKSGKPRLVGLGAQARLALSLYLIEERGRGPGALFFGRRDARRSFDRRMSSDAIRQMLQGFAKLAGVEVSSHDFRRAAAARLRAQGVDLGAVMRQLGHTSPVMTLIYSEEGEQEGALRAFHEADQGVRRMA